MRRRPPTDPANLWPQPWDAALRKDKAEAAMCKAVCEGHSSLKDAQPQWPCGRNRPNSLPGLLVSQAVGKHGDGKEHPGKQHDTACGAGPPTRCRQAVSQGEQGHDPKCRKQREPDWRGGAQAVSGERHRLEKQILPQLAR